MSFDQENSTLIIPEGLLQYKDVTSLFEYAKDSAIFYKCLDYDLHNLEFYTHLPCIVFNCRGVETITSYDFKTVEIHKNELLFLPQGMHLISDFIKKEEQLEAYLFFFDDNLINQFLSTKKYRKNRIEDKATFYKMNISQSVFDYVKTLKSLCKTQFYSKPFLELKLLEVLHLIDSVDEQLVDSLLLRNKEHQKRNIKSLMKKYFLSSFTLQDYASLSGRSLSSFHKEFKKHNNMTPKQYLLQLRLEYAQNLLQSKSFNVSEVAIKIGYVNVSHFIKAFKKTYGVTPKQLSQSDL